MKNEVLQGLVTELKKSGEPIWKRVAMDLERPTRQRRIVNLTRINQYSKENETVIIPGKVLGSGTLDHKVVIAAYQFSQSAAEKITEAGSKMLTINELIKESPKGKKIRILG
ncbi:MAG: 50S ribosomal protein L18e [Nanoarchaeota archaeon]|nr:50S ribosomal protein L18e [Nanoarchaeota archaeon]MBU1705058.1 50S ribosomal protein L18e [Nanoarchaeota archaeon]